MSRPLRRYRYTFSHELWTPIVIESAGETPCAARGFAWQTLEAQLRQTPGAPVDNYWRLAQTVLLGIAPTS